MKSCQKKILMLRNTGSEFFDEVYFIIKDKIPRSASASETEMIREANRIVNDNLISGYFTREGLPVRERLIRAVLFAAGAFAGAAAVLLLRAAI